MAMSRWVGSKSVTSTPPIETVPSVTSSSPAIIRKSVDFPHPDGPTSTMNSPSATASVTSSTARTPPANSFVTWSSSIAAMPNLRSVTGLHCAHDVYTRLERHVAGVEWKDSPGDGSRFVAREIDDEWSDLLGSGNPEDVETLDRCARVRIVEPNHLRLGRYEARRDGIHAHPVRSHPSRKGSDHGRHPALGCRVRVETGATDQGIDRARHDDRARALVDHLSACVFEYQERAREVDVDHALPDIVLQLGEALIARVDEVNICGAVVESVEAAEARDRLCHHPLDQFRGGDIHVHCNSRAALRCDGRAHFLRALAHDVRNGDRRALGRHGDCAGASHPRPTAYHERDLSLQPARLHRSSSASWSSCHGRYWPSVRYRSAASATRSSSTSTPRPGPSIAPQLGPLAIGIGSTRTSCSIRCAVCW